MQVSGGSIIISFAMLLVVTNEMLTLAKAGSVEIRLTERGEDVMVEIIGSIDAFQTGFMTSMSNPPTFDLFEEGFLNSAFDSNGNDSYKVDSIQNPSYDRSGCTGFPSINDAEDTTEILKSSDSLPAIGFRLQLVGSVDIVQVYVDEDYIPGSALSGSAILMDQSFASLGIRVGVPCSVQWGSGESITLLAVVDDNEDCGFICTIGNFIGGILDAILGFFGGLF